MIQPSSKKSLTWGYAKGTSIYTIFLLPNFYAKQVLFVFKPGELANVCTSFRFLEIAFMWVCVGRLGDIWDYENHCDVFFLIVMSISIFLQF